MPDTVLFVSAGLLSPKKRDHRLARRQLYLNYGALTLASLLDAGGRPCVLAHGAHEDPVAFLCALRARGLLPSQAPVMLSLPSFYALGWAQVFCRALKEAFPGSRIVAGGRWVTAPDPQWLRRKIPELDEIVTGLGERVIAGLVGAQVPSAADFVDAGMDLPGILLNHRLVDGFEAFQPSVETSRGCGMGCTFCEERAVPLTRLREPATMAEFLAQTQAQYGGAEIRPYLQSSFFMPSTRWAERLREEVRQRGISVRWRCETRVDGMTPATVAHLAAAGMGVVDLGLESASPRQLGAMRKTQSVDRYLRSASDLLGACERHGVMVKVNVLLYAGETARTIDETRSWLDQHGRAVTGVSVGPVVAFGPPRQAGPLIEDLARYGARAVDPDSADLLGVSAMHLSDQIGQPEAEAASLELSRRFMDRDEYFALKGFSYYPRGFSRAGFEADVAASDPAQLPFRM